MVAEPPNSYGPELRDRILEGFRGDVPPLPPSLTYRLALAAVAIAMVLLPLVYLGLIAGLAWGLWAYGGFFFGSIVREVRAWYVLILCFLPLFAGAVVLICLVKPFFARRARRQRPVRLDPNEEPLLFEFVASLCAAIHAPTPAEIHVDCQVNASASFRRGLLSLFGDDLVLTLGLPMLAGLSVQQLAGVVAHELGHFSQRAGLRMSVVVRAINFWFARLVYERDRFDAILESTAARISAVQLRWPLGITLFMLMLTRRVLWALMMLGHVLSSFLMRQMEYDADRYEVRLAGFRSFDFTMRELFALGAAYQMAMASLGEQWKEGRLVDNFPRLVLASRQEKVRQIVAQLEHFRAHEQEQLFGTHPTARQRTTRALREKGVGVFSSDLPASVLFSDHDELERQVSLAFYREMLGNQVRAQDLLALSAVGEREARAESDRAALVRYFQNPNYLRALPLPSKLPTVKAEPPAVVAELEKARRAVLGKDLNHSREIERYREAAGERVNALQAMAVIDAGYRLRPGSFGLVSSEPVAAERAADRGAEVMQAAGEQLERYEGVEVRRLLLALILLGLPPTAGRIAEQEALQAEIPRLLACAAFLKEFFPRLFALREVRVQLDILAGQVKPKEENPKLRAVLRHHLSRLQDQLKELHRGLRAGLYPFDHARADTTLAQYAISTMPADDDFQGLMAASGMALDRLHEVYARLLGRLAWIAEQVEVALGLPPLTRSAAGVELTLAEAEPAALSAAPPPAVLAAAHQQTAAGQFPAGMPSPPPAAAPIAESKAEAVASREAFALYFRSANEWRALQLPDRIDDRPADPRARVGELRHVRQAAVQAVAEHDRSVRACQEAERALLKARRARSLLAAGIAIQPADLGIASADETGVSQAEERALAAMKSSEAGIQAFEAIQTRRLLLGLALLGEERIAIRVGEADRRRSETRALLAGAVAVHRSFPLLRELRQRYGILEALGAQLGRSGDDSRLRASIAEHMGPLHKHLLELQRSLHRELSPFANARGAATSLAESAIPGLPASQDFQGIFAATGFALKELADLNRRILGRLVGTASAVEQALGLEG